MNNWGFGENNCGYETNITTHGCVKREGNVIEVNTQKEVVDVGHFNHRIAIEQYLDKNGRTILWRRFNKNDWAKKRYGKTWTEMLPENERLEINGETYVHWYDCVTDYIF